MNPANIYAAKRLLTTWEAASYSLDTDLFSLGVTARLGTLSLEFRRPGGAMFRVALYSALANLNANLSPEANTCALVATPGASPDIGFCAKAGPPGSGSWVRQADFTVSAGILAQLRGFLAARAVVTGDDVLNALSAVQGDLAAMQARLASADF